MIESAAIGVFGPGAVPWDAVKEDPVLAFMVLEVVECLEAIDRRLGVSLAAPEAAHLDMTKTLLRHLTESGASHGQD